MNSSIALAGREWNGTLIHQRITDGYVNATAMCQANNARLSNYLRNARTCAYINALAAETGILATCLVQLTRGGRPDLQGTWVHPRLSVDLARWISPAFAVFMDGWFLDWIQGGRQAQPAPAPAPVQLPAAQRDSYYFRRHWERFSHSPEQRWSQTTDIGRLAMALACLSRRRAGRRCPLRSPHLGARSPDRHRRCGWRDCPSLLRSDLRHNHAEPARQSRRHA